MENLKNAITLFLVCFFLLYYKKPGILFEERTEAVRAFGIGFNRDQERKTLFSLHVVTIALAIAAYTIASIL